MTPDTLFQLANLLVLPLWALIIFFPHWNPTKNIVRPVWIVAPIASLYLIMIVPNLGAVFTGVASPTIASIAQMLSSPQAAVIAWAHFLTFDLFVGRWVYLDSRQNQFSAWWVSPCLFFVFMLGPIGFLAYIGIRALLLARRGEDPIL